MLLFLGRQPRQWGDIWKLRECWAVGTPWLLVFPAPQRADDQAHHQERPSQDLSQREVRIRWQMQL